LFKAAGLACAVCAGLAGLLIVKSGLRLQGRLCRQAKAELRPQGPFPCLPRWEAIMQAAALEEIFSGEAF